MSWDELFDRAAAHEVDRDAVRAALARRRSTEEPAAPASEQATADEQAATEADE